MKFYIRPFILAFILLSTRLSYGDIRPVPHRFDVDWGISRQAPKSRSDDKNCTICVTIKNTLEIRLNDGNVISINLDTGEVDWGELEVNDASVRFWHAVTSFFPAIRHNTILDYIYRERPAAISKIK